MCANCGARLAGAYCSRCGQEARGLDRSVRHLAGELADELFGFDSRLWRTLVPIVIRPGAVTARYLAGERARFVSPVRLYLFVSLVYFLLLAWLGGAEGRFQVDVPEEEARPSAAEVLEEEAGNVPPWAEALLPRLRGISEDPEGFRRSLIQGWSYLMFFLVPLFGALVHLSYRGRRRFYLHHLVFAVHVHVFAFLALSLGLLLDRTGVAFLEGVSGLIPWLLVPYLFLALRAVYGGRRWATALRTVALSAAYGLALAIGVAAVVVALFFL